MTDRSPAVEALIGPARPMCVAEEWHRDGRGLWAMRGCQYYAGHKKSHAFGPWKYGVTPPSLAAQAQQLAQAEQTMAQLTRERDELREATRAFRARMGMDA